VISVLHVGKFYPPVPGGMEQVLQSICHATAGRVESRALVFNTAARTVTEDVQGIAVTRVGTIGAAGSVPVAPSLGSALRAADADLMVLHEPNPWALLALAISPPPMPLAIWFHSEVVRPALQYALFYHPLVRRVYARARRIIVSSPDLGQHARALAPYRDRLAVVPFGIDVTRWTATPSVTARAAAIRRRAARPLLLFAGRMVPYKGVGVLLEALSDLDVSAVLVGDGPSKPQWEARAAALGLGDRVQFAGTVPHDELAALYHACDLFVLPSVTRAEAFGYVQLEAMACGKPVVSTTVPSGVAWVNRHEETGLTVPPGDPAALREAVAKLAGDEHLRTRLGHAGRSRVLREFTMEQFGARAADVFIEAATSEFGLRASGSRLRHP
jgi:rhamnosyl/mannosyltransferase